MLRGRDQSYSLRQRLLAVREEERKHIARELHDQVIQSLIGLNYRLRELRARAGTELEGQLHEAQTDLHQLVRDVRQICGELRVAQQEQVSLVGMVQNLLHTLQSSSASCISLRIEGQARDCSADLALCLVRVLQEALANVQKHARAQNVVVSLMFGAEQVVLVVQDDGVGFDAASVQPTALGYQLGLTGMHERLVLVGGMLEISSAPGRGTCVQGRVPCRAAVSDRYSRDEVSYE